MEISPETDEILLNTAPPLDESPLSHIGAFSTGFVAGAFAQSLCTPVRNILHVDTTRSLSSSTFLSALKYQYQNDGFSSFWNNNIENILRESPKVGLHFLFYHAFMRAPYRDESRMLNRVLYGSFSGIISKTLLYPISSLKYHKNGNNINNNIFMKISEIYQKEGLFSFYDNYFANLPFSTLTETIQSSLFAGISQSYRVRPSLLERIYLATITAIVSKTLTHPIQILQKNVLTSYSPSLINTSKFLNIRSSIGLYFKQIGSSTKKIYREKKLLGFYEGYLSGIVKDVPKMSISFICLEEFGRFLDRRRKLMLIQQRPPPPPPPPPNSDNLPISFRTWRWF